MKTSISRKEAKIHLTIELSQPVYEHLQRQAQAKGLSVAEIAAQVLEEAEANRRAAAFEQMRAEGIFLPKKPVQPGATVPFKPIEVRGKPVSEVIIKERR